MFVYIPNEFDSSSLLFSFLFVFCTLFTIYTQNYFYINFHNKFFLFSLISQWLIIWNGYGMTIEVLTYMISLIITIIVHIYQMMNKFVNQCKTSLLQLVVVPNNHGQYIILKQFSLQYSYDFSSNQDHNEHDVAVHVLTIGVGTRHYHYQNEQSIMI